jgi:cytochrome c biogenesis protein CcmG, thiol:disulfide interchange protein DsbE
MTTTSRAQRGREHREARQRAKQQQQRKQRLMFAIVGAVVLVLAVVIGVLTVGESADRAAVPSTTEVAGDPTIEGEPLPGAPEDPSTDQAAGDPVPVASGADFDGEPVTVGEPGTPQLVMFMASWCPACQEELPEVVEWLDAGGLPEDVEIVSVATSLDDTRPNWPPQDWFEEEGYDGPVLVDDVSSSVAEAYGLQATPYWVAIDGDGQVAVRVSGMIGQDQLDALADTVSGT